jgi:lipopolysaccharide transport system ATP-binding protein
MDRFHTDMNVAIRAECLSKMYRVTHHPGATMGQYRTLREDLANLIRRPFRRVSKLNNNVIWALKDVTFEVRRGETLGIIGANGAGKSTLLKILSRITRPTAGGADLYGRVGSLLEVGTGFHNELTGRENIFLSGAVLGMRRDEIRRRFDEIVAFAGIETFLDTPVKRYSSGMYMRLAFAVAAHLETEILLVDEVLAVGDGAFQRKCLGKMRDVAEQGRTVLFVSHTMSAITHLCPRAIWLNQGHVMLDGPSANVVSSYLNSVVAASIYQRSFTTENAPTDGNVRLKSVKVTDPQGKGKTVFNIDEGFTLEIDIDIEKPVENLHFFLYVTTQDGTLAFGSGSWDNRDVYQLLPWSPGQHTAYCIIPGDLLNQGQYYLTIEARIPMVRWLFKVDNVLRITITEVGGAGGMKSHNRPGVFRPRLEWVLE